MDFKTEPQIVSIISGDSTPRAKIEKRASHAFIFKESGESTYFLRGESVTFTQNTVLFIPEGESYHFEKSSAGQSIYHLVNFHASLSRETPPRLFLPQDPERLLRLFLQMEKKQAFADAISQKYELLAYFYQLLAQLADSKPSAYLPKEKKALIAPAVDYLADHLFDPDVRITDLHTLCGISAPTFRRIFTASFGASPRKYVILQRMKRAKAMLESDEQTSITAIAMATGFNDPLYFSRLFKSHFHVPPSHFKK
jgi:AraC-like DNA-binding protein